MATATARTRVINLRTDEARRTLIDRAAEALGKDRTEFMLDAATREAQSVLLDRRLFHLDEAAFRRFAKALDAPPSLTPSPLAGCGATCQSRSRSWSSFGWPSIGRIKALASVPRSCETHSCERSPWPTPWASARSCCTPFLRRRHASTVTTVLRNRQSIR